MQQHDLKQGSPAWLAHRQTTHNASDAPAMMGCSPYEQRGALIRRLATGISPDVDAGTQKLFDDGHRFEALARPGAETIVGDDLSPLSGSIDAGLSRPLAASFDGLTFMRDTNWEHKSLNEALRAILPAHGVGDHSVGARLPLHNRVQLEQQMLVSGADQSLFTASKWNGDTLVEARHCWYASDPELRAQIVPGWAQLEKDVAAYAPTEAPEPAKAEALDHLPAVSVRLDGALSVAGNLPTFAQALKAFISKIPTKPATDNEFATVDAACKALKKAEETLDAAEAGALASITDVEAMRRAVAECRKLARDTRLAAEKLVERRKVEVKEQAVIAARRAL
ncbi:MAG: endonuclease, partial [Rubrivivax sp.]